MVDFRLAIFSCALSLSACHSIPPNSTTTAKPKLTQEQEEKIMLMALDHNRDQVFGHMNSFMDSSWQKTPAGLLNLECSIAIMEKHKQKYPQRPWAVEGVELRNQIAGLPTEERKIHANACAEKLLEREEGEFEKSMEFEKSGVR